MDIERQNTKNRTLGDKKDLQSTSDHPDTCYLVHHRLPTDPRSHRQMPTTLPKTLLDKPNHDWTRRMLFVLRKTGIGWASQINRKLDEYGLETSWDKIAKEPLAGWKNAVLKATEKRNKEIMIEMCYSRKREKTKTRYMLDRLKSDDYERKPLAVILRRIWCKRFTTD